MPRNYQVLHLTAIRCSGDRLVEKDHLDAMIDHVFHLMETHADSLILTRISADKICYLGTNDILEKYNRVRFYIINYRGNKKT